MGIKEYEVVLTNGIVEHTYIKRTLNQQQAIILAQAEAIQECRGYELVSCTEYRVFEFKNSKI